MIYLLVTVMSVGMGLDTQLVPVKQSLTMESCKTQAAAINNSEESMTKLPDGKTIVVRASCLGSDGKSKADDKKDVDKKTQSSNEKNLEGTKLGGKSATDRFGERSPTSNQKGIDGKPVASNQKDADRKALTTYQKDYNETKQ